MEYIKVNYDNLLRDKLKELKIKPKLLIHSCCGPCSSYVIDYLKDYFDITILYFNPNIYPKDEYLKRLSEQKRLVDTLNLDNVKVIDIGYDDSIFYKAVKGHAEDTEGGERCHICYNLRMKICAKYAKDNGYDYFTTTLSVSPYKNSYVLNEIGKALEEEIGVKYLYADFKKRDGYKKSIELSHKYNLYRQDYCGCVYSLEQRKKVTNY